MQAIKDIYRIGKGPSSSHTIAPKRAAELFKKINHDLDSFEVTLFGSLSLTGKGHKTDEIIIETLGENTKVVFNNEINQDMKNLMIFKGFKDHKEVALWHVESLGGGAIYIEEYDSGDDKVVYPHNSFNEIKEYLVTNNLSLIDYILKYEPDILDYLKDCINVMIESVKRGLNSDGLLNKRLNVYRSAKDLYSDAINNNDINLKRMAYAYAAGEENADGHIVCTAPTLGSCGVVASFVYSSYFDEKYDLDHISKALAVGGLFANLIKQNASISGAIGGCQAEVGTACSLAASAITYLRGGNLEMIEYSAEVGVEHHLGLTCDPVFGYVIIPCIERNAVAILRSYDASKLVMSISKYHTHNVSFDMVVNSMNYTGKKLSPELKETSLGGLALEFKK